MEHPVQPLPLLLHHCCSASEVPQCPCFRFFSVWALMMRTETVSTLWQLLHRVLLLLLLLRKRGRTIVIVMLFAMGESSLVFFFRL